MSEPVDIENYLRTIAINTSKSQDTSYQFPVPDESSFELAASATYSREIRPQQKLIRLSISVPEGVVVKIYKNGTIWRRYSGMSVYDDGYFGEYFDRFKITVTNSNDSPKTWGIVATFIS